MLTRVLTLKERSWNGGPQRQGYRAGQAEAQPHVLFYQLAGACPRRSRPPHRRARLPHARAPAPSSYQNANYVAFAFDGPLAPFAVFIHQNCVNPLREVCDGANAVKTKGVSMAKFTEKEAALVEVRPRVFAAARPPPICFV